MPSLEDHCRESMSLFGKPYKEVHLWLDEFAGSAGYGFRHRKVRHHEVGIAEVCRLFGRESGVPAMQHVVSDLKTEGWIVKHHPNKLHGKEIVFIEEYK